MGDSTQTTIREGIFDILRRAEGAVRRCITGISRFARNGIQGKQLSIVSIRLSRAAATEESLMCF